MNLVSVSYGITSALCITIALTALWAVGDIPAPLEGEVGARFFPQITASALLLVGLLLLLAGFRQQKSTQAATDKKAEKVEENSVNQVKVLDSSSLLVVVLALTGFLYIGLIEALGYSLATLICSILVFTIFGHRNPFKIFFFAVAATAFYYLAFFVALGVYDAPGSWIDLSKLFT